MELPIVQPLNYAPVSLTGYILLAPLGGSRHENSSISVLIVLTEQDKYGFCNLTPGVPGGQRSPLRVRTQTWAARPNPTR